jgi:hypothetical protein
MNLAGGGYGRWLLDWLYDQPLTQYVIEVTEREAARVPFPGVLVDFVDTGPFFARLGLPGVTGYPVVDYLGREGWIVDGSSIPAGIFTDEFIAAKVGDPPWRFRMKADMPSPCVRITPAGIDAARQNRASYRDIMDASDPLNKRLLRWLYSQQVHTGRPADLVDFLTSDHATINNSLTFTLREAQEAALYLHKKGLITDPGKQPKNGLGAELIELTSEGYECNNGYDADIRRYLERNRQDSSTNITITGNNTTNLAVNSPSTKQSINTGISVDEALRFADYVSEVAAVLRPKEGSAVSFEALASELRDAAISEPPDKGRLRRFIETLMRALEAATPTVTAQMAIDLGEKAIHAIGG